MRSLLKIRLTQNSEQSLDEQQKQTTTNHNKPQQTTTNHNKPQQTTTNHNKTAFAEASAGGANKNKPQQTKP
ncbi:MAG: hypothetical protein H6562_11250 [Lewinellaceae bacterium]|nr:hypothetical protein [Lewinellaceae bacterium]